MKQTHYVPVSWNAPWNGPPSWPEVKSTGWGKDRTPFPQEPGECWIFTSAPDGCAIRVGVTFTERDFALGAHVAASLLRNKFEAAMANLKDVVESQHGAGMVEEKVEGEWR